MNLKHTYLILIDLLVRRLGVLYIRDILLQLTDHLSCAFNLVVITLAFERL